MRSETCPTCGAIRKNFWGFMCGGVDLDPHNEYDADGNKRKGKRGNPMEEWVIE